MSIYNKAISDLTPADLQELLSESAVENIRLEFKREVPAKDEAIKKLSAFANTYGGYMLVGAQEDGSGRLVGLPGVMPVSGFRQKIVQWCYDSITPLIEPFVSDPIESPQDSKKVCYVIFVQESEEAPHFLHSRKGCYIRTDEFSQRFEPRLATYEQIQHLANRRALAVERREALLERSEERWENYIKLHYSAHPHTSGTIGATLKLVIVPRFPVARLAEHLKLLRITEDVRITWRQVNFPAASATRLSQHESSIVLDPGVLPFSLFEANVWGQLYHALEIERIGENETPEGTDREGWIHLNAFLGNLLVRLEHARVLYRALGYNGSLQFLVRMQRVLGKQFMIWRETSPTEPEGERVGASQLDDEVQFSEVYPSEYLQQHRDGILRQLVRNILLALNWPKGAASDEDVDRLLEEARQYSMGTIEPLN